MPDRLKTDLSFSHREWWRKGRSGQGAREYCKRRIESGFHNLLTHQYYQDRLWWNMHASGTLMKSPGKGNVSGYRRALLSGTMTQRKFWVELSALNGVWWALPLILPSLSCSKHSAASSRFAMHSSYEEVVSGVESSFSLLKPYLHDSIITWSIQTLSVNQFKQWHISSPFSSLRKEIQLKVTFVKCKSCIVQNELLSKPQKIKILRIIIMLWNLQSRKMNSIKRSGFGMSIKSYFLSF